MNEHAPKILCEICRGWHPTEEHIRYEKENLAKRMTEIKARPDSAYRFDALGFKSEKKDEMEPWMHTVIEKAKELGDDLQQSDNFLHMEIDWVGKGEGEGRLLQTVRNGLFAPHPAKYHHPNETGLTRGGQLYIRPHNAGTKFEKWSFPELLKEILVQQETYLKSRSESDLQAYKALLKEAIDSSELRYDEEEKKNLLESMEDRKRVVSKLMEGSKYGIIFSFPEKLSEDSELEIEVIDQGHGLTHLQIWNKDPRHCLVDLPDLSGRTHQDYWYTGEHNITYTPPADRYSRLYRKQPPEGIMNLPYEGQLREINEETLEHLSSNILNGLYVYGGVKEQREFLQRMLEVTKDNPERRLPVYNFYGKLVWPRPPEDKAK